jgi:hypothetical protein
MNLIFGKRRKFKINSRELEIKVHYLGNVLTSIMKGDGCVDKPVGILWDNHIKCNGQAGMKMKITLTQGGLRAETLANGVTEYYGHRIYYTKAHPIHPKLFVWVYQHVGKTLKTEIRCHAVLCKKASHARLIASLLHEQIENTFNDYKRDKKRMQNSRLCGVTKRGGLPQRKLTLKSTNKYKPPIAMGMFSAPKLDSVEEEDEELNVENEEGEGEKEEEEEEEELAELTEVESSLIEYDNNYNNSNNKNHVLIVDDKSSNSIADSGIDESFSLPLTHTNTINRYDDLAPINDFNRVSYDFLDDLSKLSICDNDKQHSSRLKSLSFRLSNVDKDFLVNITKNKSSSFSVKRKPTFINVNNKSNNEQII